MDSTTDNKLDSSLISKLEQSNRLAKIDNSTYFIRGYQWYFYLVPRKNILEKGSTLKFLSKTGNSIGTSIKRLALFDRYPRNIMGSKNKLLICYTPPSGIKLFTSFNNFIEFSKFSRLVPKTQQSFYEIILGEFPQKPHFDIDLDPNTHPDVNFDNVKDQLISGIIKVFQEKKLSLDPSKDLLLFTSHGKRSIDPRTGKKTKKSMHLVINNYCHLNNVEAKAFYQEVIKKMTKHQEFIDTAVYSSTQQFRIVGSQKIGSFRPKIFLEEWTYGGSQKIKYVYPETPEDEDHKRIIQLEISLVTKVSSCSVLPSFYNGDDNAVSNKNYDALTLSKTHVLEAFSLLKKVVKTRPFPFKPLGVKGGIIMIKRLRPSFCSVCRRTHQHENPFMVVIDQNVYFHCRRARPNNYLQVGTINQKTDDMTNVLSAQNLDQMISAEEDMSSKSISIPIPTLDYVQGAKISNVTSAKNVSNAKPITIMLNIRQPTQRVSTNNIIASQLSKLTQEEATKPSLICLSKKTIKKINKPKVSEQEITTFLDNALEKYLFGNRDIDEKENETQNSSYL